MAKKPVKPSPVFRIDFEDQGQDFLAFFVQNRVVIDCTPYQRRVWCGSRIAKMPAVGQLVRFLSRHTGKYLDILYPVTKVEQCTEAEVAEIIAAWRELCAEIINE